MYKSMLYKVEKLSLRLIYAQIDKGGKVIQHQNSLQIFEQKV